MTERAMETVAGAAPRTLAIALLALACSACSITTRTKDIVHGTVEPTGYRDACLRPGERTTLRYTRFQSMPWVPFAYSGWQATVTLDETLAPGTRYRIPVDADAALWSLSHHARPAVHDLAGQVDILDVDDGVVLARVELASAGSDWRLSGRYRFTTAQGRVVTCVEPQPPPQPPTGPPKETP